MSVGFFSKTLLTSKDRRLAHNEIHNMSADGITEFTAKIYYKTPIGIESLPPIKNIFLNGGNQ